VSNGHRNVFHYILYSWRRKLTSLSSPQLRYLISIRWALIFGSACSAPIAVASRIAILEREEVRPKKERKREGEKRSKDENSDEETISRRTNKRQARREQSCSRCRDLIRHIARVYRSVTTFRIRPSISILEERAVRINEISIGVALRVREISNASSDGDTRHRVGSILFAEQQSYKVRFILIIFCLIILRERYRLERLIIWRNCTRKIL